MAGVSEKIRYMGYAVRGAVRGLVQPTAQAREDTKARQLRETIERGKRDPGLPESLLRRSPKLRKIELGSAQ